MTEEHASDASDASSDASQGPAFSRLGIGDIDDILRLLRRTWPEQYGATGCPDFSAGYLHWLYAGPDSAKHLLYGCRLGGELVGFKSALYRPLAWRGHDYPAHLATHLTIAPELAFGMRMTVAGGLGRLQTIEGFDEDPSWENFDLLITYFEQTKILSRTARRRADRKGLHQSSAVFRQAIVSPRRARAFLPEAAGTLRDPEPADMPELSRMMREMAGSDPVWQPSAEALWHHIAAAPQPWAKVVMQGDRLRGFFAGYRLDWVKGEQPSRMMVAELMAYRDPAALALLLRAALDHAEASGLRGIVIENATWIPDADRQAAGIIFTSREMNLLLRSPRIELPATERFILDVK